MFAFTHPDRRDNVSDETIAILARMDRGLTTIVRASRELPFAKNDLIVEGTKGVLSTSGIRWLDQYWLKVEDASGARLPPRLCVSASEVSRLCRPHFFGRAKT